MKKNRGKGGKVKGERCKGKGERGKGKGERCIDISICDSSPYDHFVRHPYYFDISICDSSPYDHFVRHPHVWKVKGEKGQGKGGKVKGER